MSTLLGCQMLCGIVHSVQESTAMPDGSESYDLTLHCQICLASGLHMTGHNLAVMPCPGSWNTMHTAPEQKLDNIHDIACVRVAWYQSI